MIATKKLFSSKHTIALFFIVILGAFLRIYRVGEQSLWIDEGFTIMQEKAVYNYGYPLLMSGNIEYKDLLLPYLLSFARILFNENFAVFRMISSVFGTLSIIAIYKLGKEYFNKNIGLAAAFFLSFSYWHIAWSRQIRSYSLFIFFLLISLLCLYYLEKARSQKWFFLLLSSMALAILTKLSFGIIFASSVVIYFFLQKNRNRFGIYLLITSPIFLLLLLNNNFIFRIISLAKTNYLKYYTVDYLWNNFGIIFVLAVVGLIFYFKDNDFKKEKYHFQNLFLITASLVFFSFFTLINQKRYLLFITPLLFIYSSYCLQLIAEQKKNLFAIMFASVVIIDQLTVGSLNFKLRTQYFLEDFTPQPNFKEMYSSLKLNDSKLISAYPFMDFIYTQKIGYALPISYTGMDNDPALHKPTEYYSNAHRVLSAEELYDIAKSEKIIVILDDMSISRSDKNMVQYIQNNGQLIYESINSAGQKILAYQL